MTAVPSIPFVPPRRFENAAEWLRALGDVPLERIVFDPWPGTATEADLLRLVEREKRLCELIDGTLVEKTVGYWEARIAAIIIRYLESFVEPRGLGLVSGADSTLRMRPGRVRLPDVAFISRARVPTTRDPVPTVAPDLAVEVLSPGNTDAEMAQKLREYFQSGSRLVWIVDPSSRTIAVYHPPGDLTHTLDESQSLDGGDVLPGFALPIANLFRDLP